MSARVRTVVAAWGASPRLTPALDSIDRAVPGGEIVVVGTVPVAGRARVVPPDPAQPSTPGSHRNQGARGFDGPYLLFADDDMVLEPEFVSEALALLDRAPEVAAVGGRVHERQWRGGTLVREIPDLHRSGAGGEVEMLAAAWIARRSAFEAVGGFDARLPAEEDMDLCIRLHDAGGKIVALDRRAAYHDCTPRPSLAEIRRRWSSGLFAGQGILLRQTWGTPAFVRHFARQRLYLATVAYAALGVVLVFVPVAFAWWALGALVVWAVMSFKKRSVALGGLSILAWLALGLGIVRAWVTG